MPLQSLAGCIIVDTAGRILLLHRCTPGNSQWETPGGKVEPGEDLAAAAAREVREELGIEVEILDELGSRDFQEAGRVMRYTWFRARCTSGTPRPVEAKHDAVEWFSQDALRARIAELSPNTRNFLTALDAAEVVLSAE